MLTIRWLHLLRRLAAVMGVYSLLRLLFLGFNRAILAGAGAGQVASAFLHGLRFDLAAVAMINAPFILLTFLPRRAPGLGYQRLMKAVFLTLNFPFVAVNVVDLEFFQFNGRRSDLTLLGMAGDAGVHWITLATHYWPLVLLGLLLLAALFVLYGRLPGAPGGAPSAPMNAGVWILNLVGTAALAVIAARGGWQMKPLSPVQAAAQNQGRLAQLTLNSSFTVIKSRNRHPLTRCSFFSNDAEPRRYLRSLADGEQMAFAPATNDNVVVLVVESLSAEYCGAGNGGGRYTPFLDSLAEQSLFFPHHYANGRRSIEAMPSILAGLPSLMDDSFTESLYCDHPLSGLGTILAAHGYTTSFFHGAKKGTMNFDLFMRQAGIQNYFGKADYPNKADDDGGWGIFDEPYLQCVAAQLSRQEPPFASMIFTLTSHHPYPIPAPHRGRFKKGTLAIHESIGYVDYALKQFFAAARLQPWYSNTLFIITADHTQKLETPEYANPLG